ncbi:MAG: ATP-dependent ligase [Pseudonocardiales bacterium]|nr:ATP-dependent ligase [Pseudonocardiales bacterium]
MAKEGARIAVQVDGRDLMLTNLDKVLYPAAAFTKGEVIDYYTRMAPVLLPHLAGRPLTVKRYPNGVDAPSFFEKNASRGKPAWVRTVRLPVPGSTKNRDEIDYLVVEELATLVWLANLAALELHIPQWTVGPRGAVRDADLLVVDLDPGPPASIVDCSRVALQIRDYLARDGLTAFAKTSGSKGMQLSVPIAPAADGRTSSYAKEMAQSISQEDDRVLWQMTRALRPGKVLIDWSQNNAAKTTVSVYSLRARDEPTASTPVTWDEVEQCAGGADLRFTAPQVLERVASLGDLYGGTLSDEFRAALPS